MPLFAEFVLSAAAPKQFPKDNLPEIALVGRSNVGKSSMINSLTRMKKLARTSNTPGRTQTLNFYRIWPEGKPKVGDPQDPDPDDRFSLRGSALEAAEASHAFYFVDMPGYGFARVSAAQRQSWSRLIEQYLLSRENLKAVIQIVDLRHPPTKDDVAMWEWLRYHGKLRLCLATKADKLSRAQRLPHAKEMAQGLGISRLQEPSADLPLSPEVEPLLVYSAEEDVGREALWHWVNRVVGV